MAHDWITVRGVRVHNLKNIDVDIPRHKLVVITGLSGSGKSSLAFDTLYAEGQRRYVESLSAYARQFLQLMEKPDVDLIEGLSPAISIEQKATSHNPRSTVGTVTEIHDYLRLLYARAGTPYCPDHGQPLEAQSVSQMVDAVLALPADTKLMILAPVVANRKGEHVDLFEAMQAQGFVRFRIRSGGGTAHEAEAKVYEVDNLPKLKKNDKHSIEVVVDRVKVNPELKQRLAESFETALRLADGRAIALEMDTGKEHGYSSKFACPICSYSLQELEPRLFSFNNPMGACPHCDGLGQITFFDPKRVVAFPNLSLASGAIKGWDRRNQFYFQMLQSLAAFYDVDIDVPFEELSPEIQQIVLHGSDKQQIPFTYINEKGRTTVREHAFEGIIPNLERRYKETDSIAVREELAKYQNNQQCPECHGTRLRREARFVKIGEADQARGIYEINGWPLRDALTYFLTLNMHGAKREIADKIVQEITARLNFLNNVGLDYLSLERSADTLSGGEAQRIRLASQIGSGLTGVMYVLDEPSIGLHQRDNDRLIGTLKHLRDLGNSVLVVEHDEDMIRASDYVVDIGPGAGVHGGQIIAEGTPKQVEQSPASLTGEYLSGKRRIEVPKQRTAPDEERWLRIINATGNNLRGVSADIPVGLLTCITGVSGSGKSTLVQDVLYAALLKHKGKPTEAPGAHRAIHGHQLIGDVVMVDQTPIGRTTRSNPAVYVGAFESIRDLFAKTPLARERQYTHGTFSFNSGNGRCPACGGNGFEHIEMQFLSDVYLRCPDCDGKRYRPEILEVRIERPRTDGERVMLSVADVLELTVSEACILFRHDRDVLRAAGIRLASAQGCNANAVSEHAIALMLGILRRVPEARDNQAKRFWRGMMGDFAKREDEAGGKTVIVVGTGRIGVSAQSDNADLPQGSQRAGL